MAKEYTLSPGTFLDRDAQPPSAINLKYRLGREMDELIGICRGVLADGFIVERETRFLADWARKNQEVLQVWPARDLAMRLERILLDGTVSKEESEELKLFLEKMTGETPTSLEKMNRVSIENSQSATSLPIDDPAPEIEFVERSFCFTGKCLSGTRAWCINEISLRGGECKPAEQCDYLVVGSLGSRDWAHSSHGRKIEAAMKRKSHSNAWPKIVAESRWIKFIHETARLPTRA
jgi:hypothetical protein